MTGATGILLLPLGRVRPVAFAVVGKAARAVEVTVVRADTGWRVVDRHLRAEVTDPCPWLADVLTGPGDSMAQADELARRHPGALVVAVHHGPCCWLRVRTGLAAEEETMLLRSRGTGPVPPWPVWASVVHACRVAGLSRVAPVTARLTGHGETVSLQTVA